MHSIAASLATFSVAAAILTITPGLDTALVLRTAAIEGGRRAFAAGLGIVTGCLVWACAVAGGLGVLFDIWHVAFTVLRWIGAAYLLYVGIQLLVRPRNSFSAQQESRQRAGSPFLRGAMTNLLNPKVGIFYITFLPLFVPADVAVTPYLILLGAIHAAMGLAWFALMISAIRPLTEWMRRPKVIKSLDRLTGGIFVAFGLALAVESDR